MKNFNSNDPNPSFNDPMTSDQELYLDTVHSYNINLKKDVYVVTGAVDQEELIRDFLSRNYFGGSRDFPCQSITIPKAEINKKLVVIAHVN